MSADAYVECDHHWHGPFDDLAGQEQCCQCNERRRPFANIVRPLLDRDVPDDASGQTAASGDLPSWPCVYAHAAASPGCTACQRIEEARRG